MKYVDDVPELGEFKFPYPKNETIQIEDSNDGIIIEIEGLDGSGKSTQLKRIKEYYEKKNKKVFYINFIHSDFLKNILLKTKWENCDTNTFTFMYLMGLSNVYYREIIPKLKEDYIVLLDRYIYTIITKALANKKVKKTWILNSTSIFRKPDIKIFIDTPVEECLQRKISDNTYLSYWECGGNVFLNNNLRNEYNKEDYKSKFIKYQSLIRNLYLEFVEKENWYLIDGLRNKDSITNELVQIINKELKGDILK